MQFAVHLYTQVRIKVTGVEAQNHAEAMKKADESVDYHHLLHMDNPRAAASSGMQVEIVDYAEAPIEYACVDPILENGQVDFDNSVNLDPDGQPLVDCKTVVERKALANDKAQRFMTELLDAIETLSDIAHVHGVRTLADLMYLHAAILEDGFIDVFDSSESEVMKVINTLPSSEEWKRYIRSNGNLIGGGSSD